MIHGWDLYSSCTTGTLQDYKVGTRQTCILVVKYLLQICVQNKYVINLSDLVNMDRGEVKIKKQKGGGRVDLKKAPKWFAEMAKNIVMRMSQVWEMLV